MTSSYTDEITGKSPTWVQNLQDTVGAKNNNKQNGTFLKIDQFGSIKIKIFYVTETYRQNRR